MSDAGSSDPVDPLEGYVGFGLFPKSFKSILPVPSSNPFDLHVIDSRLKPMALQHSPSKLKALEKLSGTSEIPKSGNPQALKQKNEVFLEKAEENPRQRRPALGLKRSRFSLKPDYSQTSMSLLPTFDAKNYKDSEEMWKAYDRHEFAKKEIKKHMGGDELDADQHNPSPVKQSRRQGLLGRSVQYKHLYPSADSEISENGISSQDTFETSIHSPLNHSSQPEPNDNVPLEEMDLASSKDMEDDRLNDILGKLQSRNSEDLEGDGAVSLLLEQLNFKSFELGKLCLPEFVKPTRRTSIKPKNVLTDVDNLVKGKSSRTSVKRRKGAEGSIHLASPTPPKSPFASFSTLNKRILRSNPSSDPFSADDIDRLPVTNTSVVENGNKQSELVDMGEQSTDSDELKSPSIEQTGNTKVAQTGSPVVAIEEFSHAFERSMSEDSSKLGAGIDVGSSRSHVDMEDNTGGGNTDKRIMDDTLSRPDADTDTQENGANDGGEVDDKLEEAVASAEPELHVADSILEKSNGTENDLDQIPAAEEHPTEGLSRNLDTGPETHEIIVEDYGVSLNKQIKEKSRPRRKQKSKQGAKRQSLAEAVEEHPTDGLSRNLDTALETQKEIMQEHSELSSNQQIQENLHPRRRQTREVSKRHSLAGAGTLWQSGVRRSTRIRTRPLDHWKGERLLYGRIHDSLPTVIGMKYASPGKGDGRAPLKVKSFVSDDYKELVELAALH